LEGDPAEERRRVFRTSDHPRLLVALNWKVVENKKESFTKAFAGYSPAKVARYTEADVARLMNDTGIVRNEKKIRATIQNAAQFLELKRLYGDFDGYPAHFAGDERRLQADLADRFHHVGPSTARVFLWSVGYPLKPTKEEREWWLPTTFCDFMLATTKVPNRNKLYSLVVGTIGWKAPAPKNRSPG